MNNLAHSIIESLAGKSCSVEARDIPHPYMGFLQMRAAPSIMVDAPHFFVTQTDVNDFEIVYFGPDEYSGNTEVESFQVRSLAELEWAIDEIADRTKPHVIIAELAHLGLDRPAAVRMIADKLEDGDMWEEQVLVSLECQQDWRPATFEQTEGRIFRTGHTAEVHVYNIVDSIPQ
ncbi:hypothetical protein MPK71_gp217 [Erwinia phage pEa_SNUABM_1]|uniref:Uncharacterized protein n=1 Tax=Erwinia phage pEa_SNUABM_1 TaxID=2869543 RepID=A0AAE7XJG3_9CAUD|nr:hypothetical protein MPK71_gp217 [Erwinia phage pEa_SNUABM_1]QZE57426.1 hypothetical protein pEaSNUABM1_00217 [Erwinia phage pEa_SNUABM_1]